MNRRALVAVVAAVAVLAAAVGWIAGQRIKSPAEIAAEQAPPEPSLITVEVEERELSQNLVVRGTAQANESTPLEATSASGETIITRLTKEAGAELVEGDVAIEVAGRPIFVLQGDLPVFRSLIPTLDGPDVEQLEEALVRLGYDPGTVDGLYDGDTADAVEELYRDAGYQPEVPTDEDLLPVTGQEEAVDAAEALVAEATRAVSEAQDGPPESVRLQLEQEVTLAEQALADAQASDPVAEAEAATAQAEADAATVARESETAASRLEQAQGGTHPDTGQPPTEAELAELEQIGEAAAAARQQADQLVTEARAAEENAADQKVRDVEAAEAALQLAQANRTEGLATSSTEADEALRQAQADLTDEREALADAQAKVDTEFPAAELYFLPSLPRTIQTLTAETGDRPTGPVMTVTGSGTTIESAVSAADRRLISVGDTAVLEDEDLGITAEATIGFVAENPGGGEVQSDRYRIRVDPNEELPEDALNVNFRITIPITSSGGAVMAVPLAALSAGSDGTTRVEAERSPGQTELVRVNPGLRAEGFVEIEVIEGSLDVGDRVVVGRDLILPGEEDAEQEDTDEDEDGES